MIGDQSTVILTREKRFLGNLPSALEMRGYRIVNLPTLITQPLDSTGLIVVFSKLEKFTDLLFVSRNAVEYAMRLLEKLQLPIPSHMRVLAVGSETAKQLEQYQIDAVFPKQGSGVEALLALDQLLELNDRKLLIVRGTHGLSWPIEELRKRGAEVEQTNIYTQSKPVTSQALIEEAMTELIGGVFLHSAQSAINFMQIFKPQLAKLSTALMVVGSERIAKQLTDLGWSHRIRVAESPSNEHMMFALIQFHEDQILSRT